MNNPAWACLALWHTIWCCEGKCQREYLIGNVNDVLVASMAIQCSSLHACQQTLQGAS